ncbi:MAG: hypothetical protein OHK0046_11200 [Anaerolineae bacterium]
MENQALKRIERILSKLAIRRAAYLTPPGWDQRGNQIERIQKLARELANHGYFVFVGEVPASVTSAMEVHMQDWVRSYGQMYNLLAQELFPAFSGYQAYLGDQNQPMVVVFDCQAAVISGLMSGYVAPYVAVRQPTRNQVSELELHGFMSILLRELAAEDLPRETQQSIIESGVHILRHISLTGFDAPILDGMQIPDPRQTGTMPVFRDSPPPPPGLPQERVKETLVQLPDQANIPTPTEEMFVPYPIPRTNSGSTSRRPPVPDLPTRNNGKKST